MKMAHMELGKFEREKGGRCVWGKRAAELRQREGHSLAAEDSLKPSARSPSNFMNRCVVKLMDRDKLGWRVEMENRGLNAKGESEREGEKTR